MTPAELQKELTILLNDLLADIGFSKKRIGVLRRKQNECEQFLSCSFTRDRGLPGNRYSLGLTMSIAFVEVDKLTELFNGREYDAVWDTGAMPLYTVIPDRPVHRYKYCSNEPLERLAKLISDDVHTYASSFYDKYDTLDKLEKYFDQHPDIVKSGEFRVVRENKYNNGCWCCKAVVLCVLKKWDKLQHYLDETDLLMPDQKERIREYAANQQCRNSGA